MPSDDVTMPRGLSMLLTDRGSGGEDPRASVIGAARRGAVAGAGPGYSGLSEHGRRASQSLIAESLARLGRAGMEDRLISS